MAIEPDRRIVFSWGYEGDGQAVPAGSSTVHIGMVQRADRRGPAGRPGAPESCHGLVRFGWAAVGPGEIVLATGSNVAGTAWTAGSGG